MTGLLMVCAGALVLFYTFTWATLSGGGLPEYSVAWWKAVLGTMFNASDSLAFTVTGLFLVCYGFLRIVRGFRKGKAGRPQPDEHGFDPEEAE